MMIHNLKKITHVDNLKDQKNIVRFRFLPKRLFGRIVTFYMCKYVDFLAYLTFKYINMYI